MLENHDCQHPTGPQRQTEKNSVGWGLGVKEAGAGGGGGGRGEGRERGVKGGWLGLGINK